MDVECAIFSAPRCLSFHGTCPSVRLWLAHWKVDDPLWRHALYSLMHRQSSPSLLCAGQWSKMGLVVARLAEGGLCPRCKPEVQGGSRESHAPVVVLPGKRGVQVTVELVGPCSCQFSGLTAPHTCAHRSPSGRLECALPGRVQVSLELLVVLCC